MRRGELAWHGRGWLIWRVLSDRGGYSAGRVAATLRVVHRRGPPPPWARDERVAAVAPLYAVRQVWPCRCVRVLL